MQTLFSLIVGFAVLGFVAYLVSHILTTALVVLP